MKRSLVFSLILHVIVLVAAFLLYTPEKPKKQEPFVARLITPEETQTTKQKPVIKQKQSPRIQKQKITRSPRLPKNLPDPREIYAVPSKKGLKKEGSAESDIKAQKQDTTESPSAADSDRTSDSRKKTPDTSGIIPQKPSQQDVEQKKLTTREKLFDKQIISSLIKKPEQDTSKNSGSITFDTKEFKYYGYMQRLKEKIESAWQYPVEAARKGIYGDLFVKFTIKKDGKLGAVELVRTSGHKLLDDAAIKAIRDAADFWALENLPDESLTITAHFIYSLYGTYIR